MIAGLTGASPEADFYFAAVENPLFHASTAHMDGYIKQSLPVT
jgi:hypothetical protein